MAISNSKLNSTLRAKYFEQLVNFFAANGEEVLTTKSNEFCFPCVDSEGNEKFIQIVVKVPNGSRDGDDFDGYALAEEYAIKQKEKAELAKINAEKKAKKIAKDKAKREEKGN